MATEFKLPDLGENVSSGDVVSVLVGEGDVIESGQDVIEMETEKAVAGVPCPHAGRVTKVHVKKGDTLNVGSPVLTIDENGQAEAPATEEKKAPAEEKAPAKPERAEPEEEKERSARKEPPRRERPVARKPEAPKRRPAPEAVDEGEPEEAPKFVPRRNEPTSVAAGPGIRRLARELGVDLDQVDGTGPGGRVTRADVENAPRTVQPKQSAPERERKEEASLPPEGAEEDEWGSIRREPLTQIRRAIARQMVKAASTIPQVTHCDDADVTELERIRKTAQLDDLDPPVKVTMLPFVMKAVCQTLRNHPTFNASFDDENDQVVYKDYISLGVAVETDRGLIVPVIRDADRMDILELAYTIVEAADRVRSGRFDMEELRGGTFTISNVGAYGGSYSTPIINHPEVAIVLVGRGKMTPVYNKSRGNFEPRMMLPLSLSYDHRLIDGAMAAKFMRELIWWLESPGRLMLLQ